MNISPEALAITAGAILSLLVSYIPGLNSWFDQLTPTPKRLVMLGLLLLAAAGTLVWQCRGVVACYGLEWEKYLTAFIFAAIGNQTAYGLTPLSANRRALRENVAKKTINEPAKE